MDLEGRESIVDSCIRESGSQPSLVRPGNLAGIFVPAMCQINVSCKFSRTHIIIGSMLGLNEDVSSLCHEFVEATMLGEEIRGVMKGDRLCPNFT